MSKRVLVYDEVLKMLEEAKDKRIEDGWKRGTSLEQIASEAIIFWMSQGNNEKYRDINDEAFVLEHAGEPENWPNFYGNDGNCGSRTKIGGEK